MKDDKYKLFYFWENLIRNGENVWQDSFRNMHLRRESVFINSVIINRNTNLRVNSWAYYPDIKAALGFLQHVFMPSVFEVILTQDGDELPIPIMPSSQLLQIVESGVPIEFKGIITVMRNQDEVMEELWNMDKEECYKRLKQFAVVFNKQWMKDENVFSYFNVFKSADQAGHYLIDQYIDGEMLEDFQMQTGLTEDQWQELYEGVYDSPFIINKFIEILNRMGKYIWN